MRLRRKPWVDEAIHEFDDFVFTKDDKRILDERGKWSKDLPLFVELGTGKGDFIRQMAENFPEVFFVGIELQQDVLYQAAKKIAEAELKNVRLAVYNVERIEEIFAPGEVARFYINFCDPWPKLRHAKRRLTHRNFLQRYRRLLTAPGGELFLKTDNEGLFRFSLAEFAAENLTVRSFSFDAPPDDAPTEYERKFRALNNPICKAEVVF